MQKILFFGGTGGLGEQTVKHLSQTYKVHSIGSRKVDLSKKGAATDYINTTHKDVDILVVFSNYNYNSMLHKVVDNLDEVYKQIDINIKGVTECISAALSVMRSRNFGRIILASSVTADRSVAGTAVYASTKAYYENLIKTAAIENAHKNITTNCIQLGYMDGGLTYTLPEEFINQTIKSIPAKRLGTPEEIAMTIDFLIKNSYINGSTIKLTGGL